MLTGNRTPLTFWVLNLVHLLCFLFFKHWSHCMKLCVLFSQLRVQNGLQKWHFHSFKAVYINNSVLCYVTFYLLYKSTSMYKLSLQNIWLNNAISLSGLMACTCTVVGRVLPMVLVYCMPSQHHSIKFHQADFLTKHWVLAVCIHQKDPTMVQYAAGIKSNHFSSLCFKTCISTVSFHWCWEMLFNHHSSSHIFFSHPCWSSRFITVMLYQIYGRVTHCLNFLATPAESITRCWTIQCMSGLPYLTFPADMFLILHPSPDTYIH